MKIVSAGRWPIRLGLLLILPTILLLGGCQSLGSGGSSDATKTPTSELIKGQTEEITTAHNILTIGDGSVLAMLDKITPANISSQVPLVKARVNEADSHIVTAIGDAPKIEKQATQEAKATDKLEAENARLRSSSGQIAKWNNWAIGFGVVAALCIGAGIYLGAKALKIFGFCLLGPMVLLLIGARVIEALNAIPNWAWYTIIVGTIAATVGVYWFLSRKVSKDVAKDAANWIPKPDLAAAVVNAATNYPPPKSLTLQPVAVPAPPADVGGTVTVQ